MPVLPGSKATFTATLIATDTFEVLPRQPVELRQFDPAVGALVPIAKGITDERGQARFPVDLPTEEDKYKFASYFAGTPDFKADTSPVVEIEIKRPP